jgi:dTDP-glucose 4,6-dehydratase
VVDFDFPDGQFPFVIHAATERPFEPDAERPLGAFSADTDGTRRVLDFARAHGVRRLLFTSSGAVYGKQPHELTHIPEEYSGAPETIDATSTYGHAKRVSEFMCAMYSHVFGFDAMIARLFAFVGPLLPLSAHYAVGNFIGDALKGGPVRIAGDGTPHRSYLYASDLAIWLWTILLRGRTARPYNVGSSDGMPIESLARLVVDATTPGMPIEIARRPVAGAPAPRYVPSTERAEKELDLRSYTTPAQGIRRTYDWYRAFGRGT